jgi:hypothetical protein
MSSLGPETHVLLEVHAGAELGCCFAILVSRLDSKTALAFRANRYDLSEP